MVKPAGNERVQRAAGVSGFADHYLSKLSVYTLPGVAGGNVRGACQPRQHVPDDTARDGRTSEDREGSTWQGEAEGE